MKSVSARAARDIEDQDEYEPFWPVLHTDDSPRPRQGSGGGSLMFGLVLVVALLLGTSSKSRWISSVGSDSDKDDSPSTFASLFKREGVVKYREDFSRGFQDWVGEGNRDGWTRVNGLVRPGKLRLWAPTESLSDYQFEFEGQIEHKGVGWAYRASDLRNYYATKLVITHPGPLPRAELVRYAVVHGAAAVKTRLPLPLLIRTDTVYHVQVNVRGDQFSTLVNGQMVDTWTNPTLKKGGVGLFTDTGENASIHYAAVNSRTGALAELLSYFGFWVPAGWASTPGLMQVY